MSAFAPEPFAEPVVSPDTATLFRRAPYISIAAYKAAPTAVAVNGLVPGGSSGAQNSALAAEISRASGMIDDICFHRADGTLAASPTTESGWIRPREGGVLQLFCNYKPVLEVDGLAFGVPGNMQSIGDTAAQSISIQGRIIQFYETNSIPSPSPNFPGVPYVNGKLYVVWRYVNGFPHTSLAAEAKAGESKLAVTASQPGLSKVFGVYPGTQLVIHDSANTEIIVVKEVNELELVLESPLLYTHQLPTAPETVRVTAIPWAVEQAAISLTSYLIKTRGTRAMTFPQSPKGGAKAPLKQAGGQANTQNDYEDAMNNLKPYITPVLRST